MTELASLDFCALPDATDDHRQLRDALRRFVDGEIRPSIDAWDEAGSFPRELYFKAGAVGLLGLGYPERYGGTPCDTLSRIVAVAELARAGAGGLNASLMSHSIMIPPLLAAGSPALLDEVLPRLLTGAAIGALCVTEPSGGSDVAALTTRAHAVPRGWVLNGAKAFITSGMRADLLLVAARTGGPGPSGISLLLVDGSTPGIARSELRKTGWWCSDTAMLHFEDCFVPTARLVGQIDTGFALVMHNFNSERLLMAAQAAAFSIVCIEDALAWARERSTFGRRLIEHQVMRQKIVRMVDEVLPVIAQLAQLARQLDVGRV
ncbi:MAG: acyl-CoA dehydrogenase family protein, partial [Burkholderiaceae bacterium]|nr:acyl-CoA dehydrogenase family protein [Burkholderiaceae bacterium]